VAYQARWQAHLLQDFPTSLRLARGLQRSSAEDLAAEGRVAQARPSGAAGCEEPSSVGNLQLSPAGGETWWCSPVFVVSAWQTSSFVTDFRRKGGILLTLRSYFAGQSSTSLVRDLYQT